MRTFVFRPWKAGCRKPGKANGIAKYLENHGIHKKARQNGKNPLFDAAYLLVDGLHEALVSEEVREQVQVKVAAQAKKYEKVNRDKKEKIHLLSGILKCPVCGAGMYGNSTILGVCRQWIRCEGKFILV